MSGHKRATVTISQEEYRRLYEAEQKNYYDVLAIPETIYQNTIQASQANMSASFDQMHERQMRYESVLEQFQDSVRDTEHTTTQTLVEQQAEFYSQLMEESQKLWSDTNHLLDKQASRFENNVISQHDHLQNQLSEMSLHVGWFQNRLEMERVTAVNWINDATRLIEYLRSTFPIEHLPEKGFRQITATIEMARRNYQSDLFESAISLSQQSFAQLSTMRLDIEETIARRSALIQAVTDRILLLDNQVEALRTTNAVDLDGEYLPDMIDVNYWTDSQLDALKEELFILKSRILDNPNLTKESDLAETIENILPVLTMKLGDIVQEARRGALNAQLRYNMAHLLMVSLMEQGYRPKEGKFNEDDYRKGYLATAINPDGSEIDIRLDPAEGLDNELHLETSHPGLLTETELRRRSLEVMQSLQSYGFNVGKIEQVAETHPSSYRHVNKKIKLPVHSLNR
jgi:hypothetical protein